jgi:hypothetical protein
MSSYLGPVPNIPSLAPTNIYNETTQPLRDQLDNIYTDVANVVNDKKRRDSYLTIETITNDLWTDGNPVFSKTVATGVLAAGGVNLIAHGIVSIADLVDIRVMVSDGTTQKLLPYASSVAASAASVDVTAVNVVITTGAAFGAGFSGYAILQYTKT